MCGIAGAAWSLDAKPLSVAELRRMTAMLTHRGPDSDGFFHTSEPVNARREQSHGSQPVASTGAGAAFGQRRLSIIDLEGGRQPLCNEDGTVWITFNGEIYNYRELRRDLERKGHRFQTESDTETIVHLYEEHGTRCVQQLRGMFAFAIWDTRRQTLFLARDRVGKKPLVYRCDGDRIVFASELKALLQVDGAPRELDPVAVDQYLTYQYVPHPGCILRGYHKLPPGHIATFSNGNLKVDRYWSPPYSGTADLHGTTLEPLGETGAWSHDRWQTELRNRLTEAVRLRLRSDVPLGAFLSGGVDSTIISGLMQQLSETKVHTFSIGFPVKQFDETSYAREAAKHLGTEHHETIVRPEALQILPKLIWHYDEPFADSSAIPTMYLSEMTRREVKVALSGDGGDELFAGYDRYNAVRLGERLDKLPRPVRVALGAKLWQHLPSSVRQKSKMRRLKRFLGAVNESPERRYLQWIGIFDDAQRQALYMPSFRAKLEASDAADFLLDAYRHCPDRDFVTRTSCADVLTYLPCDILNKVDIASMAYSLECRCPFLDHHVVELAARMPVELKRVGNLGKRILIETFKEFLPASIQRRPKMGFGVPLDHWFRDELRDVVQDVLLDSKCLQRGMFWPVEVVRLVNEHTAGQRDHSNRLWALLCLEMWQRTYLDAATIPAAPRSI